MALNASNYLDLYDVFVNELIGDIWLFVILGMILIALVCIWKRIPFEVITVLEVVFLAIIFAETLIVSLWAFTVLFVGALFYYHYSRIAKR
jgi:hypothetical protein|tara:strand:+ start:21319 stop:21591 length:273 start_codon:yes stop_codon:yes gene_type:complete